MLSLPGVPDKSRPFWSPIRIINISHSTENLPSIREEDHYKKREVPFLFDFATMTRAHLPLDVIYTMSFIGCNTIILHPLDCNIHDVF
jgi:hypothetical protein